MILMLGLKVCEQVEVEEMVAIMQGFGIRVSFRFSRLRILC